MNMQKIGRNDPCPCGSGKKYKHCCMQQDQSRAAGARVVANQSAQQIAGALSAALAHHNAGRLIEAEGIYRQLLQIEPDHADALHLLGLVSHQTGRSETAIELIGRAIAVNPSNPLYYNNLGNMLHEQGKFDAAIERFRKALALMPAYSEAHSNLGRALQAEGKLDEAADAYRKAIVLKPDSAEALSNLGGVLQAQGKPDAAVQCLLKAIALQPDFAGAQNNLGLALQDLGKLDQAEECYRKALSLKPDFAEAHFNLGNAYLEQFKLDGAEEEYRKALAIKPDFAQAFCNLGAAFRDEGRHIEAIANFRSALALQPDFVDAYSNLLFAMQFVPGQSPQVLLAEHQRFAAQFEAPLQAAWQQHGNSRELSKRLKIGYVSPDFRRHAVAYFIEPVLANHDRSAVEVFCYFNSTRRDDFTDRIGGHADHWLDCKAMSDKHLAECIRADGVDILVDLAGHTVGNRIMVFARKPAPVQVTYLGYPGTSGLSGMDYRLTDAYADPEGSEANYSEELLRMPHSLCCYRPARDMPEVVALPALQNGYITFGSFNNSNKIGEPCIDLWAALLRELPSSRLLMVTVPEGEVRERLAGLFAARGVGPERLEFKGKLPSAEFQRMFQRADIALDPMPVTGGTTTCESLWMGLPVVVLAGERFISRVGYSFLSAAGVPDYAADSPEGYIGTAMRLAADIPRLAEIRSGLRKKLAASALMDEASFARNLEHIYRDIWARWCASAGAPT